MGALEKVLSAAEILDENPTNGLISYSNINWKRDVNEIAFCGSKKSHYILKITGKLHPVIHINQSCVR